MAAIDGKLVHLGKNGIFMNAIKKVNINGYIQRIQCQKRFNVFDVFSVYRWFFMHCAATKASESG